MNPLPGSWQRARLQAATASPWRNGGGITHELAAEPAGQWRWRVSVARIDWDGPFSRFEGVDRQFAVIRGAGVRLHLDGRSVSVLAQGPAVAFSGEGTCHAELIDGPTLDFNLMSRHSLAHLQRCASECAPNWTTGQTAGLYACAPARLSHACGAHTLLAQDELLWTHQVPDGPWTVSGADALAFCIGGGQA